MVALTDNFSISPMDSSPVAEFLVAKTEPTGILLFYCLVQYVNI